MGDRRERDNDGNNDKDEKKKSESNWFVTFVDYGNRASVARGQFKELPEELRLQRCPALAFQCQLAGIQVYRKNQAMFDKAGYWFSSLCFQHENQKLKMKVLFDSQWENTWYVELFVGDQSINQMMAREGFVTLVKLRDLPREFRSKVEYGQEWSDEHKLYLTQYFDAIKANVGLAKDEHKNIWEWGDVESADEDNFPDMNATKKGGKGSGKKEKK